MTTESTYREVLIDVATRAIYDYTSPPASRCDWCAYDASRAPNHTEYVKMMRIEKHDFSVQRGDGGVPREYREYAAQLYGMLIERNGPFGAIAIAAHEAIIAILTGTDCPDHWHCDPASAPHRCGVARAKPCATCGAFVFDPTDFIRAIVTEALGGAKVEEAYGKIMLPCAAEQCSICKHAQIHDTLGCVALYDADSGLSRIGKACQCPRTNWTTWPTRQFSVPHLVIEGAR